MNSGYSLNDTETVIKVVHRHWSDLIPVVVSSTVTLLLAIGISYLSGRFADQLNFLPAGFFSLVILVLVILSAAIFLFGIYVYRQNKLILTDMHLIEVSQRGLFSRSVSQLSMAKVQDVSAERQGVFPTMFDYGTIEVETAGEVDNFVFRLAPHPQQLADECLAIHEKFDASTSVEPTGL